MDKLFIFSDRYNIELNIDIDVELIWQFLLSCFQYIDLKQLAYCNIVVVKISISSIFIYRPNRAMTRTNRPLQLFMTEIYVHLI